MTTEETDVYADLIRRSCLLTDAALRCLKRGKRRMAKIWADKAERLDAKAHELEMKGTRLDS